MVIRRIGVMSAAKLGGIIGLFIGLIAGVLVTVLFSGAGPEVQHAMASQDNGPRAAMFAEMGAMAIVVLPIAYAIGGIIGSVIYAAVYNLAARLVGGLRIETD